MKKNLLIVIFLVASIFVSNAQVTQINSNKSLDVVVPVSSSKTFLTSSIDSSIWVTDATLAGTVQIAPSVKFTDEWGLLNGKIIFSGSTAATGIEVYISDGTTAGTVLVKDINAGVTGSDPREFVLLNGFLYFTAQTAAAGRELWRTDGTSAGTTMVKDIVPGTGSSNAADSFNLISNGSFLLFDANTSGSGNELWKSDGTSAGTVLLKDINAGVNSSAPNYFTSLNNIVLFTATDATHGNELWKTDGTSAGTVLVKDINSGAANSTSVEIFQGFSVPFFIGFHIFNNHAYFNATDGVSTGEVWVTDGATANTTLIKDFTNDPSGFVFPILLDAVNFPGKFIFPFGDGSGRSELWECDGTPGGTTLLKSFSPIAGGESPFIFIPNAVNFNNQTISRPLFQGNKFFFSAGTTAQGDELWSSDGTSAGTNIVKDINAGSGNGIDVNTNVSYLYTSGTFFFAGSDGIHGNELWQTDGSSANTSMVADINTNAGDADPQLSFFVTNGSVLFTATNGDDLNATDLYVVNGSFAPLPLKLKDFTVTLKSADGLLSWNTLQEINTKNFTVQRSYDGQHFENIGIVEASRTSYNVHAYTFIDAGIANQGKSVIYYRLSLNDVDGKSSYTNVISLKINGKSQWNVRILSNPIHDDVNLLLTDVTGNLKFTISDISGKMLYTKTMENTNVQISLPGPQQKGIYILVVENNTERKAIKFIKD